MHYHLSPETFLVLQGKASVKGLKGEERIIEKNEIVFFGSKDYYQITSVGDRNTGAGGQSIRSVRRRPRDRKRINQRKF